MKKIIIMTIVLIISIFSLTGCIGGKKNITILMYDETDMFINDYSNSIKDELSKKYNVSLYDCKNNQIVENEIILSTLKQTDLFIINLVDRVSANSIILKITEENIPIIFYNREPNEQDITISEYSYYVGGNSESDGVFQAQIVDELYKKSKESIDKNNDGRINTVIFKGEKYHQDAENRTDASIKRLIELGYEINILNVIYCDWKYDLGYDAAKNILEDYDDIELILSNNDEMAIGAIDYFKEINYFEEKYVDEYAPIIILGVNGTSKGLEELENGTLYASVLNDKETQANVIIQITESIFNNIDIKESIDYEISKDRFIYIDGKIIKKNQKTDEIPFLSVFIF